MFKQIEYFGERHELHLFTMLNAPIDSNADHVISQHCKRTFFFQFTKKAVEQRPPNIPRSINKFLDPEVRQSIIAFIDGNKYDVVLIEHIYLASYLDLFSDTLCVLTEHNIESKILKQIQYSVPEIKKHIYFSQKIPWLENFPHDEPDILEVYENTYWEKFKLRVVMSDPDKVEMDYRCNKGETFVVGNGTEIGNLVENSYSKNGILLMASMLYLPNLDGIFYFVNEIWPIIVKSNPNLILYLVGSSAPPEVKNLDGANNIKVISNPESIEPIATQCSVSIVPLRLGGGTRLKILHALAMGLPTISTTVGCEGLNVKNNETILIKDTPYDFAEAVLKLTSEPDLWNNLRNNGRILVENQYSWNDIYKSLENKIIELIYQSRLH
jgi:glycosyltransferase involved in cell wall biosynthesis